MTLRAREEASRRAEENLEEIRETGAALGRNLNGAMTRAIRTDDFDEEAAKWFERKAAEAQISAE